MKTYPKQLQRIACNCCLHYLIDIIIMYLYSFQKRSALVVFKITSYIPREVTHHIKTHFLFIIA